MIDGIPEGPNMIKIAVVTGSRSDYGLLEPLIKLFHEDRSVELQLFVTGSHLSPQFGNTVDDIHFPISERIDILLASDSPVAINKAMGLAMISFGEAYERHRPDLVVVLGDRFESFCAACAAHVSDIPIAHIHGGELTEGSMDDAFRHSITKMAQLHFCAADVFVKRVIQLGENPSTVFAVGALGCAGLGKRDFLKTNNPRFLVAHYTVEGLIEIFTCLGKKRIGYDVILPCNDVGCLAVKKIAESFGHDCITSFRRCDFLKSLREDYFAMIGNSSAGIIEAPCLGVPSINVGNRQKRRPQAVSVQQAEPTVKSISQAIEFVLSHEFEDLMKTDYLLHYKGGNVAQKIHDIILQEIPGLKGKRKQFYDIKF